MDKVNLAVYKKKYLQDITRIWNDCIADGNCFFWLDPFNKRIIRNIIKDQKYVGIALINNTLVGFYILHNNNSGRGSHIANALYAVDKKYRNNGIGFLLGNDSIEKAKQLGYKGIQFNSVIKSNIGSINLWKKLNFEIIGEVPEAFYNDNKKYESILIMYKKI